MKKKSTTDYNQIKKELNEELADLISNRLNKKQGFHLRNLFREGECELNETHPLHCLFVYQKETRKQCPDTAYRVAAQKGGELLKKIIIEKGGRSEKGEGALKHYLTK